MRKFLSILLIASSVFIIGCAEEEEPDIAFRDEYIGVWNCREITGINAPQTYLVNISAGSGVNDLIITNLYSSGTSYDGVVSRLEVRISPQSSNGISVSGAGIINKDFNQIELDFAANDGSGADEVKAVLTP